MEVTALYFTVQIGCDSKYWLIHDQVVTESVDYSIIGTIDQIEIRKYPRFTLASVYGLPDNKAFGRLFGYITGNNRARAEIPMTAPVISSESSSKKIPMTAPVISDANSFSFVMPGGYTIDSTPEPLDKAVQIEVVPERTIAVIRFRGRTTKRVVTQKTETLMGVLKNAEIRTHGDPFLMRYNPPFTPGFVRRNEIGIEIDAMVRA